jgi:hypothetical protein
MSDTSHNPYPVDPTGYLIGAFLAVSRYSGLFNPNRTLTLMESS